MFYSLLKVYARFAIRIYCKKITINKVDVLKQQGPLLLACNHPNSFLDGMILTTLFDQPVYSLARGDAFKNRQMNRFLRSLRLLPVYRTSEGVENLEHNYTTFEACHQTFREDGIVLIFSEGRCENEWHLRPLKKGTARLATSAWKKGLPLTVIPTALNYSSFKKFGKEVHIYFGEALDRDAVLCEETEGRQWLLFNEQLNGQLKELVYEIEPGDETKRKKIFNIRPQVASYFLAPFALAGWLLHAPLFYTLKLFSVVRFKNTGHYDSVLTSLLLLFYPFYVLLLVWIGCLLSWWGLFMIAAAPFTAWACVQAKYGWDV